MVSTLALSLLAGAFVITLLIELLILRLSRRLNLVALPNARSSHDTPTPSIGGLAIVLVVCGYLAYGHLLHNAPGAEVLVAGAMLSMVGLWDDLQELGSATRFVCQVLAVAALLTLMDLDWSPIWMAGVGFLILWHINLYNFMDGIDGIAGAQTLVYCIGVVLIGAGAAEWMGALVWVLMGATLGFLAVNWPPAKIFMGDVGSLFLGLLLSWLVITLDRDQVVPFTASLILLAGFWFDASYTLVIRVLTGQKFMQAHRSHLYQQVAARIGHRRTTMTFVAFVVIWLMPLSALSLRSPEWVPVWIAIAVTPLALSAVILKAGLTANQCRE